MIIVGAKGHAKDIISDPFFQELEETVFMFDNVSSSSNSVLFDRYLILRSVDEAVEKAKGQDFILGLGSPMGRKSVFQLFIECGFIPKNFIASNAIVSMQAGLGVGLNIMPFCSILGDAIIGDGCLINSYASIHHDVILGKFVTVSPGCRILGRAQVGNFVDIGANAVILPGVKIGNNVTIGAGAVVTKDITEGATAVGVPAKTIKI